MPDKLTLLRELKGLLQDHFHDDINDVILFGSRATGSAREDSDYDVLIILNKDNYDWKYRDQICHLIYDLEIEYDMLIDMHIISTYELAHTLRGAQPLFINALKQGIHA
jgi:predicted nucleotidyltransferase